MAAPLMAVRYRAPSGADGSRFPFSVPSIAALTSLDLDAPVVCFVGENGSGKSTLLEAIAIAAALPSAGTATRAVDDPTLTEQRLLADALTLSWRTRRTRGVFVRAEDFFSFRQRLKRERAEFEQRLGEIEREAFLGFFQDRLVPRGLYLLDEPEAALSPQRQLTLLAMMLDLTAEGAQFIIATHSPLLLAYPGARIYSFDDDRIGSVAWEHTEHVRLTRDFLADPERYLRNLR